MVQRSFYFRAQAVKGMIPLTSCANSYRSIFVQLLLAFRCKALPIPFCLPWYCSCISFTDRLVDFIGKARVQVSVCTNCLPPDVWLACFFFQWHLLGMNVGASSVCSREWGHYKQIERSNHKTFWGERCQGVGVAGFIHG